MEKITAVNITWANKENQPYLDKSQRPYARVGIQVESQGNKWVSGFAYKGGEALSWKSGDQVDIRIEPNGKYLNWKMDTQKSQGALSPEVIEKLFQKLQGMDEKMDKILKAVSDMEVVLDEPTPEELPPF